MKSSLSPFCSATTPSKRFGISSLVYPMKSKIVQRNLRWARISLSAGIFAEFSSSVYECLRKEYDYFSQEIIGGGQKDEKEEVDR